MNQINQEVDTNRYRIDSGKFEGCMLTYWVVKDQDNRTVYYHWSRSEVEIKLKELQNGK